MRLVEDRRKRLSKGWFSGCCGRRGSARNHRALWIFSPRAGRAPRRRLTGYGVEFRAQGGELA
jgi:hypothetical protein